MFKHFGPYYGIVKQCQVRRTPLVPTDPFCIITARPCTDRFHTMLWIRWHFPLCVSLSMFPGKDLTDKLKVVEFKAEAIRLRRVEVYYDNDLEIVEALRRLVPSVRIEHVQ